MNKKEIKIQENKDLVHIQFHGYEVPKQVSDARKLGMKLFASKHIEKLCLFLDEMQMNFNVLYDTYIQFRPDTRAESETPEEFRIRSNFQKLLGKAKKHLYIYQNK